MSSSPSCFFFFNDTATTEIYTLSLHDALPIWRCWLGGGGGSVAKVAPTSRSASSVRSHPPVPLHAPDHATKDAPESGTATRWTRVPETYGAVQLPRQSSPAPRTRPLPAVLIVRFTCVGLVRADPPPEVEEPQLAPKASARDPR